MCVCHVRALCLNGRRHRHDFFCIQQPHVSQDKDRVKIWLASVKPLPPHSLPQSDPTRSCLEHWNGNFQWQIAAEWLEITQWSQWRAYSKPPWLFAALITDPL